MTEKDLLKLNKRRENSRKYYLNNKDKVKQRTILWQLNNRDKAREIDRKSHQKARKLHPDKFKAEHKIWSSKNKLKLKASHAKYYKDNCQKLIQFAKTYYLNNKIKIREYDKLRRRKKYNSDPIFKLIALHRRRLARALKGKGKPTSSHLLLGCEIEIWKKHIENLWMTGMTWDNHGMYGWHIDHIKPLASFNFNNISEIYKAFHYSNTQPLWAKENLSKGSKK